MKKTMFLTLFVFCSYLSCGKNKTIPLGGTAVVALGSDADALNPIISSNVNGTLILYFTFPDLTDHEFDASRGMDTLLPALARSWEWTNGEKSLVYHLRGDARWSDGTPITAHDIKLSYQLYDHPKVASVRKSKLNFLIHVNGRVDFDKAIGTPDDTTIIFNFNSAYQKNLLIESTQLGFVPRSVFETMDPEKVRTANFNMNPVTGKHFTLLKWARKQEIVLQKNADWKIPHAAYLDQIVFRIIPEMTTRIVELKTGNLDIVEGLSPDDAHDIQKHNPNLRIEKQSFRRFEYVGWSNVDIQAYQKSKHKTIQPHPLFGDKRVRRALTLAIHRDDLIQSWLGEYGQAAVGAISPAFSWAYNDSIHPLPYDLRGAKQWLTEAGWTDHDGDGILDRDGKKFEFMLTTNGANPRREFAALKIQSDLKKAGIVCHVQLLENNAFNGGLKNKEFDAFITGMTTAMTPDLEAQFGSDLEKNLFNAESYQSAAADSLLRLAATKTDRAEEGSVYKALQALIYEDQPVTFLYWYDNIVGINNRLQGTHVDILTPYHRYYDWYMTAEK